VDKGNLTEYPDELADLLRAHDAWENTVELTKRVPAARA
jgi:hypothetical protein